MTLRRSRSRGMRVPQRRRNKEGVDGGQGRNPGEGESMARKPSAAANPKRVAAGKLNVLKRKGLTPEGLERIRAATLANRPWEHSTGPRTPEGKARAAANGRSRQVGERSVRSLRAEVAACLKLVREMASLRMATAKGKIGPAQG